MAVSRDDKISIRSWERAKEIFEAAADLDPAARESYLLDACASDSALLAEVKDLLDFHDRAGSFLQDSSKTHSSPRSSSPVFSPGDFVAKRFRIMRLIGEGGMGEVYVAYDLELGELVALKTLRSILSADARMITSLRQEVHLARQVTHPNVCRIFDMFWHQNSEEDAIAIVSMEFLPGWTLLEFIRSEGPFSPSEALPIVRQIANGLDAAHNFGIIHGDFKSSNVMLVPQQDGTSRAVITDFGLAKEQFDATADAAQPQEIAGTPAYIAPEQLQKVPLTPAVDIYAFGVVLFEMVTGRPPFVGGAGTVLGLKQQQVEPPSPGEFNKRISPHWESAILECINKDPQSRPASASSVSRLLSRRHPWSRSQKLVAIAATLVLIVSVFFYFRPHQINPSAQAAVYRARVALENDSKEGSLEAIEDYKLAIQLDPKWAVPWAELAYTYAAASNMRYIDGNTALVQAREAALRAIQLDPHSGQAYGALGWTQSLDFDQWPDAEQSFRRALELSPEDGQIHHWFGVHLRKKGKFKEAEAEDTLALNLAHQRDPNAWSELAFLYWTEGDITRLHEHMQEQLRAYPNFELTRYLYARLLKIEGKYDEAADQLSFAQQLGMNPVTIMAERASLAIYRGNLAEAREYVAQLSRRSTQQEIDGLLLAGLYAALHDNDSAFATLADAYRRKDNTLLSLTTSPLLEPLRGDPRYRLLLQLLHFS